MWSGWRSDGLASSVGAGEGGFHFAAEFDRRVVHVDVNVCVRVTRFKARQDKKKTKTRINVTLDGLHLREVRRGRKSVHTY